MENILVLEEEDDHEHEAVAVEVVTKPRASDSVTIGEALDDHREVPGTTVEAETEVYILSVEDAHDAAGTDVTLDPRHPVRHLHDRGLGVCDWLGVLEPWLSPQHPRQGHGLANLVHASHLQVDGYIEVRPTEPQATGRRTKCINSQVWKFSDKNRLDVGHQFRQPV